MTCPPPSSRNSLLVAAAFSLLMVGCSSSQVTTPTAAPTERWAYCAWIPPLPWGMDDPCGAWRLSGERAGDSAVEAVQTHADRATREGEILRATTGIGLGAMAAWLGASALGAMLWMRQRRRKGALGYGAHALQEIDTCLDAIRERGKTRTGVAGALATQVTDAALALRAQAGVLADQARGEAEGPSARAHQRQIHDRLDGIIARFERLVIELDVWTERVMVVDEGGVDAALAEAAGDLAAGLEQADRDPLVILLDVLARPDPSEDSSEAPNEPPDEGAEPEPETEPETAPPIIIDDAPDAPKTDGGAS